MRDAVLDGDIDLSGPVIAGPLSC